MRPYLFPGYPYDLAADQYASYINSRPMKMVWVYVLQKGFDCQYMTNFVNSLARKIKIPLGIIACKKQWDFNYPNGCNTMSNFPLLWKGPRA